MEAQPLAAEVRSVGDERIGFIPVVLLGEALKAIFPENHPYFSALPHRNEKMPKAAPQIGLQV